MQRMPQMKRTFGGLKPTHAHVTVADDGTGSGLPWADGIIHAMTEVEKRLGQNFHEVSYDYIAMRDQDIGERDEYRLRRGTGAELLREQRLVERDGGGDDPETFHQTVEDLLSDADWMANSSPHVSRALLMFTTSDSKPARGNPDPRTLGLELKSRRIHLFVIGTPGSNLTTLVDAAGGFFFPLDASPGAEEASKVAQSLTATVAATVGGQAA